MSRRGHVAKRGRGSWRVEAWAPVDPATGKRRRIRRTLRGTKKDAERELTRILRDIDGGLISSEGSRVTVAEYMTQWIAHMEHRLRPTTFDRYAGVTRRNIIPGLGNVQLAKLRPTHIQAFEAKLLKSGRERGPGGLSARTVLHIHRVFSEALGQAVRWQIIAANPALAVQPPRPARPQLNIPDPETVERLVRAAEGTSIYIPVLFAAATGMRRGEILGLRWSAVDLGAGVVRVVLTYQRSSRGTEFAEPKTDRARRTIVLPPFVNEALRRHQLAQRQARLVGGSAWQDHDLVVELGDGRPMDPSEFSRKFRDLAKKAGAAGVRLHDLRHAYATMLLSSGVHPKIASEALGHSTVGITLDTYSHVLPNMQEKAAAAIQEALGRLGENDDDHPPPGNVRRLSDRRRDE